MHFLSLRRTATNRSPAPLRLREKLDGLRNKVAPVILTRANIQVLKTKDASDGQKLS